MRLYRLYKDDRVIRQLYVLSDRTAWSWSTIIPQMRPVTRGAACDVLRLMRVWARKYDRAHYALTRWAF